MATKRELKERTLIVCSLQSYDEHLFNADEKHDISRRKNWAEPDFPQDQTEAAYAASHLISHSVHCTARIDIDIHISQSQSRRAAIVEVKSGMQKVAGSISNGDRCCPMAEREGGKVFKGNSYPLYHGLPLVTSS